MDRRILVLFAHPALERSRVHRRLIEAPRDLDGVTFHDLYEVYPDLDVDARREQARLLEHDVVVFQHPLYWYSAPPLLKQWQDLVLEHGWAFGREGTALQGKWAMHAVSCGGGAEAYRPDGYNRFSIVEFLRPFEQTAALCSMTWLPPYVVYGTHGLSRADIAAHAQGYRDLLEALARGAVDLEAVRARPRINEGEDWLDTARPRERATNARGDGPEASGDDASGERRRARCEEPGGGLTPCTARASSFRRSSTSPRR